MNAPNRASQRGTKKNATEAMTDRLAERVEGPHGVPMREPRIKEVSILLFGVVLRKLRLKMSLTFNVRKGYDYIMIFDQSQTRISNDRADRASYSTSTNITRQFVSILRIRLLI